MRLPLPWSLIYLLTFYLVLYGMYKMGLKDIWHMMGHYSTRFGSWRKAWVWSLVMMPLILWEELAPYSSKFFWITYIFVSNLKKNILSISSIKKLKWRVCFTTRKTPCSGYFYETSLTNLSLFYLLWRLIAEVGN